MKVVVALRLDEKTTQAEKAHILPFGHRMEGVLRAGAVAFELRGLRLQQQRQRIVLRQSLCHPHMTMRNQCVPGADGDQALRDSMPRFRLAFLVTATAQPRGRLPERADDRPHKHRGNREDQDDEHQNR